MSPTAPSHRNDLFLKILIFLSLFYTTKYWSKHYGVLSQLIQHEKIYNIQWFASYLAGSTQQPVESGVAYANF
jgi:hypothetical protein